MILPETLKPRKMKQILSYFPHCIFFGTAVKKYFRWPQSFLNWELKIERVRVWAMCLWIIGSVPLITAAVKPFQQLAAHRSAARSCWVTGRCQRLFENYLEGESRLLMCESAWISIECLKIHDGKFEYQHLKLTNLLHWCLLRLEMEMDFFCVGCTLPSPSVGWERLHHPLRPHSGTKR